MPTISRGLTWATAAMAVFAFAPAAHATPPTRVPETVTNSAIITDLCSFPVTVSGTVTGTVMIQDNGTTTTTSAKGTEQDTFSANGITLTGLPYSAYISLVTDDTTGNLVQGFSAGVVAKVPLPNGGLFITAGRVDWTLHTGPDVVLVPDVGNFGNVAALCAALS